ncbi:MAG: class I SAM-dependent methyltransferase [Marinicaulis sp.]|nr:class I SAM-dependent methyltransferase [Marinicaulis sp.]
MSADPRHSICQPTPTGLSFFFRQICKFASRIRYGTLTFILPGASNLVFQGTEEQETTAIILVKDYAFARRTIFGGDIGFYESYADGQWDTPNLADCLYLFARNADYIQRAFAATPLIGTLNNFRNAFYQNTRSGSSRNIMAHYDLGNSFYEQWLDPTMTYSSARFSSSSTNLEKAQMNKYRSLARSIDLRPSDNILEIGSGWGGFAEFVAKDVGAKVTGLTLSPSQYDYARKRIFEEGLSDKVKFRLQDYRDVSEKFDKIASIEMFEAVGKQYWQTYFDKIRGALKPGGVAGLQIITIADRYFERYLRSTDFIQRYVFPGGILPSPLALKSHIETAGLQLRDVATFGQDYAHTLHEWHLRFLKAWDNIRELGFDNRFKKLWCFYLAYCEAGFRAGTTSVCQITARRG